ncbi:BTB domain-containing protein [Mycena sanguinolenta]|uniref:BTB domain-containing protein n=1 Tax=Mycena sanguinolenta TaxID=230812 RepID=A0A8H7DDI1_9AGAR|nr:BTB domain-containing protein [Mycena sanguinolenta]
MSPSPAKRKRTEEAPIKHSEFWLRDGSVVLQAQNTQFRVHFSVLARHSPVFRDMEELPQPSDGPSVDGCPVVCLPDESNDVEYLLKALYDPTFHSQQKLPLAVVGALIRLGRKYEFRDLLHSAAARVTGEYPTTLAAYDAMSTFKTIEDYDGIDFDMVTLLSENNILSSLPLAYYCAVQMTPIETFLDRACFSQVDLRRCVIGQKRLFLKQFQPGYTFGWARKWDFHDNCTSPVVCRISREDFLAVYMEDCDILALAEPKCLRAFKFCAPCTRHATASIAAGRKKIWDELPQMFDLPPWDQLKNDL